MKKIPLFVPKRMNEINAAIGTLSCALNKDVTTYVTCPLTSGKEFYDKCGFMPEKFGNDKMLSERKAVLVNNRTKASDYVAWLSDNTDGNIIAPSAMADIDGWKEEEYYYFSIEAIRLYTDRLVVTEDWQYSRGCILEFLASMCYHVVICDYRLGLVDANKGVALITQASDYIKNAGHDNSFHIDIISDINELLNNKEIENEHNLVRAPRK